MIQFIEDHPYITVLLAVIYALAMYLLITSITGTLAT